MNHKLRITFKNPDAVDNAKYAFHQDNEEGYGKLSENDMDAFIEKVDNTIYKFIRNGEYVTIEIDVEEGTARVIPNTGIML
jgi:ABC-type amino acid transport substrate-binding protein